MLNNPYSTGYEGRFEGSFEGGPDGPFDGRPEDRLTHLVMVDGRLVDVWRESVAGSRWEHHAERFDAERQPVPPPAPPPPTYARVLSWLDDRCGGRAAVTALTGDPPAAGWMVDGGLDLPDTPTPAARERLGAVAELLEAVTDRCLDAETGRTLRRALVLVYDAEPEVVLEAASAARVAGAVVWAVARANGLLRPQGDLRMGRIQEELGLTSTISTYGKVVQRALVGYRDAAPGWWRPDGLPDLLALGHSELLLGPVRRRLVRVRDRALEAEAASAT